MKSIFKKCVLEVVTFSLPFLPSRFLSRWTPTKRSCCQSSFGAFLVFSARLCCLLVASSSSIIGDSVFLSLLQSSFTEKADSVVCFCPLQTKKRVCDTTVGLSKFCFRSCVPRLSFAQDLLSCKQILFLAWPFVCYLSCFGSGSLSKSHVDVYCDASCFGHPTFSVLEWY